MTILPALLVTVLCAGAGPALTQGSDPPAVGPAAERQQGRSGLIIIAADIEGHLAIYDSRQQLVVELDKPAGRQLQFALDPGVYEARLTTAEGTRRAGILIAEGYQLSLGLSNFSAPATNRPPATSGLPPVYLAPLHYSYALDPHHRIELRFGGWGSGWYDAHGDWHHSGSALGAFGLEFLGFVRNDLGVGIGISSLVSFRGDAEGLVDAGSARATTGIPVVVRWYPVRRVTGTRSVEPYVTAGMGPVFGRTTTNSGTRGSARRSVAGWAEAWTSASGRCSRWASPVLGTGMRASPMTSGGRRGLAVASSPSCSAGTSGGILTGGSSRRWVFVGR